ncbi:hypothetical protein IH922_04000 [candidate division KSB1 bacterium]|nr:hypothetical protein [candidate division KSB1 bacterium]
MAAMIRLKLEGPGVCDPRIYTLRQSRPATRFWHLGGYVIRLSSCGIRSPITAIGVYSPPFSQFVWGHLSKVGKINPVFAVPRRPFTQASIEGNNSVFARHFWNRREFNTLADVDRQLGWFNNSSLKYTDYQKPDSKKEKTEIVPNLYFLRQIKESESKPGQGCINLLNEEIPLPAEWINFFVVAKWNLKNETLTVFKEQDKQQITLYEKSFLINKTKKINLN